MRKRILFAICVTMLLIAGISGCGKKKVAKLPAEEAKIEGFADRTETADVGMVYYLKNHIRDTDENIYRLVPTVTTKSGEKVRIREEDNSFDIQSAEGYYVKYTLNSNGTEYEMKVTLNTTGILVDVETEYVPKGTVVQIPESSFMVESTSVDVPVEVSVDYSTEMKMHGYSITKTDSTFNADICGQFSVTYSATYEEKEYKMTKSYFVTEEYAQNMVADYHSPIEEGSVGYVTAEYYAQYKGEKGVVKVINENNSWPQMNFKPIHSIQSYKDAGYKYIVFRMFFPEDELTWETLTYGSPHKTNTSADEVVKGQWKDYYLPAEDFYTYWTDNGYKDEAKLYAWKPTRNAAGEEVPGGVAYISEIRMAKQIPEGGAIEWETPRIPLSSN